MALAKLAPLADCSIGRTAPAQQAMPTNSDWAALRSEIERLYVRERRKLRHVMAYMEMQHGFKATQQMYKKRFTKWGIQKNSRHSPTSTPTSMTTTSTSRKSSRSGNLSAVPMSPEPSNEDNLLLMFLTSVHSWSHSFYECVQLGNSNHDALASVRYFPPELTQQMNFTFKLVIDTLNRGHGSLAGRLARKAFLLVEEMLMLDVPALIWNLLEIMHYMVASNHWQLFRLLLTHLVTLIGSRMPNAHPLHVMLRALGVCAPNSSTSLSISRDTLLTSSPPRALPCEKEVADAAASWAVSDAFLFMIEQAWVVNAQVLFDHFDDRLFQLYSHIHWDSCSLDPPTAIITAAKQWLSHMTSQQISCNSAKADQISAFYQIPPFVEDRMPQQLLATPTNTSPPRNYEALRVSSIGVLQDQAKTILSRNASSAGDSKVLLRILAGLVTAKVLEEWPAITDSQDSGTSATARISRGQAANVACAVKTSMDVNPKYDGLEAIADTIGWMRSIVTLREYASPELDPRVIQEMWRLEDALVAAGEHQKAFDVKQTAYRRLEEYIQEIPVSFA